MLRIYYTYAVQYFVMKLLLLISSTCFFFNQIIKCNSQDVNSPTTLIMTTMSRPTSTMSPTTAVIVKGTCQPETLKSSIILSWPETNAGERAESIQRCPVISANRLLALGIRECMSNATWAPEGTIDFRNCSAFPTVDELIETPTTENNVEDVADALSNITKSSDTIDIEGVQRILSNIFDVKSSSPEVTTLVIGVISDIIDADVTEDKFLANASSKILKNVEKQIERTLRKTGKFKAVTRNLAAEGVAINNTRFRNGIGFGLSRGNGRLTDTEINDPSENQVEGTSSIQLPIDALFGNDSDTDVQVSFVAHNNDKLFQSMRNETVMGPIISAVVLGKDVKGLESQVVVRIVPSSKNLGITMNTSKCAYWDFDKRAGIGDWAEDGCVLVTANSEGITCHCNHLTNFAVLVDVHGQKYSLRALDVLSIIGCVISITALVVMLFTYLVTKSLRLKTPKKILICLSLTLLCLYVVFVAGVNRTNTSSGCAFVAALLHYLTLSSVCWMGVEAVNLYLLIVKVFNADVSHFMLKASIAAWGGPLIPVLIVLAADYTQYVNGHHCFMKPGYGFYFADLLLIFIILAFNVVVFILILHKLTCGRNKHLGRSSDRNKKQSITRALNALAICAILGLTWVFGFLTIVENRVSSLLFQVLFCFFNSVQGLFIFLLFCVRPEEVRNVWKRWFGCCGKVNHDIANTRSTGTCNVEAINPPSENIELNSKSQDKASVGPKTPLQSESVEIVSKSQDKAPHGQETPQQPESVEPPSKSKDKTAIGESTSTMVTSLSDQPSNQQDMHQQDA